MMRRTKKSLPLIVLCVLLITGITWYHTATKTIVLHIGVMAGSVWDVPEGDSYSLLDDAIAKFEAQHPNVTITYQSGIRPKEYKEYIAQQILKDETPDLLFLTSDMFSVLSGNNTLQNLNAFMEKDEMDMEQYYPTSLAAGSINDTYYALPYESVPKLMFVNKSLLEKEHMEMPDTHWTWEDFYEICKAVTKDSDRDGTIDQFGYYGYTWEDAVYSNGARIYDEPSHTVMLDNERILEAMKFMRKLHSLHDEKVTSEMFDKGMVVFCPMNYSDYRTYMPYPWRVKKYSNFEWDCITMPKGPQGNNTSQIDTLMLAMASKSDHKELAWEFMKMLCSEEAYQRELVKSSQGVSVLKKVMQSQQIMDALKEDNPGNSTFEMHILHEIMENGIAIRKTENYMQVMQTSQLQIDELLSNDQDIENALISLQRELNAILQK